MRVLGIDTATLEAGVAAWEGDASGGVIRASRHERVTTHSDALLALVDTVLTEAGWTPAALDGVACGAGPGSFTGLRIGLATAKGLCFALGRPLVMVSSLAALAARGAGATLAALDAHKGEVYAALYDVAGGVPTVQEGEEALAPGALVARLAARGGAPLTLVGDGADRYPELGVVPGVTRLADVRAPRGDEVARLGAQRLLAGDADALATAAPRYIRASEAEIMKAARKPL